MAEEICTESKHNSDYSCTCVSDKSGKWTDIFTELIKCKEGKTFAIEMNGEDEDAAEYTSFMNIESKDDLDALFKDIGSSIRDYTEMKLKNTPRLEVSQDGLKCITIILRIGCGRYNCTKWQIFNPMIYESQILSEIEKLKLLF